MITKYDEMFCHQTVTTFDTPFRAAVVILSVQKNLQKMGIDLPGDDPM